MDMMAQALELGNRPHIVVATPGRIVDHLKSSGGEWDLSRVKFLVLDEADRLLSPTFAPELSHIFGALPKDRQTCLFTATLTPSIEALAAASPRPGKEKPFVHRMTQRCGIHFIASSCLIVGQRRDGGYFETTLHPRTVACARDVSFPSAV
jgi:ATP-dependent RNA helicase DDX49/DBP8